MSVLLPAFLAVPILLTLVMELEVIDWLTALTEPDDNGNVSRIGRALLRVSRMATEQTDHALRSNDADKRSQRARDQRRRTLSRAKTLKLEAEAALFAPASAPASAPATDVRAKSEIKLSDEAASSGLPVTAQVQAKIASGRASDAVAGTMQVQVAIDND
jgi:hypothetical protein|eukprot:7186477-Prymnesium_polylepis.8